MKAARMNHILTFSLLLLFHLITSFETFCQTTEYKVKGAFLEKFARFTEWNDSAFKNPSESFIISILGENPFDDYVEKLTSSMQLHGRSIEVKNINDISEIEGTHLLFICKDNAGRLDEILEYCNSKPILLISDSKGWAHKGVHINLFLTQRNTVNFEINEKKARQAGLKMNMLLLNVATIVE